MPIEQYQCDHLFLLVGTNPLPDWVAARLLLAQGGQLYLVCSLQTEPVAKRLAAYLMKHNRVTQPEYVNISNPYQAGEVFAAISERVKKLKAGRVGLNYTGGTKVMTTHGYRAIEKSLPQGLPQPVFSYLEAARCVMHFDPPHDEEIPVGFLDKVQLKVDWLRKLHEDTYVSTPRNEPQAIETGRLLAKHHSNNNAAFAWRNEIDRLLKVLRERLTDEQIENALTATKLALSRSFADVVTELTPTGCANTPTLGEIVRGSGGQFKTATELAEWLDGKWLESYVLKYLADNRTAYRLNDITSNVKKQRTSISDEYELDVVAMRGYQLHAISCYSGGNKKRAKLKLFEAIARARQLGGEASRTALVCCSDQPEWLQGEAGEVFDNPNQFKVFGRKHLLRLGDYLARWFADGAK